MSQPDEQSPLSADYIECLILKAIPPQKRTLYRKHLLEARLADEGVYGYGRGSRVEKRRRARRHLENAQKLLRFAGEAFWGLGDDIDGLLEKLDRLEDP
jgi:hypothetical protein